MAEKILTTVEVIERLNALTKGDPEIAHGEADDLLIAFLRWSGHSNVADAWVAACDRVGFWYA